MPWGAAIAAVGAIAGSKLSSDATKKAADKQAEGIANAQGISAAAAAAARKDILSLYDPAFGAVFDAAQQARSDLMSGRENTYSILNRTNQAVGNILQQGSANYQNALMGAPSTGAPQVQAVQSSGGMTNIAPQEQPKSNPLAPTAFGPAPTRSPTPATMDRQLVSDPARSMLRGMPPQLEARKAISDGGVTDIPQSVANNVFRPSNSPIYGPSQNPQQDQISNINAATGQRLDNINVAPIDTYQNANGVYQPVAGTGVLGASETLRQGTSDAISALRSGVSGAINTQGNALNNQLGLIGQGVAGGLNDIYGAESIARGDIQSGLTSGLRGLNSAVNTGRNDINSSLSSGLSALRGAISTGRNDIKTGVNKAVGYLDPYREIGGSALNREAALTGALGPDAQAQAFAEYQASPGQNYLRDQQQKALLRGASVTGDFGGGNVGRALQEQAYGNAAQNFQTDLGNIRSLATRGQDASNQSGAYQMQGAGQLANLQSVLGTSALNANMQAGSQLSGLEAMRGQAGLGANMSASNNLANVSQNAGNNASALRMGGVNLGSNAIGNTGNNISDFQSQLGRNEASALTGLSQNIGDMQLGAGQSIANNQQALAGALASLEANMGTSLQNADETAIKNAINIMLSQGGVQADMATQLASLLSNLATGQGNTQSGLAGSLGQVNASGVTNPWGNAISQLTGMYTSNPSMFSGGGNTGGGNAISTDQFISNNQGVG